MELLKKISLSDSFLTDFILKKANFSDLAIIWKILQQAIEKRRLEGSNQWQNGYPNETVVANDISKGFGYVLLQRDIIIAYAAVIFEIEPAYTQIIGKWLSDLNYVVIHRVAVSHDFIGKGVATHLFKLIETLSLEKEVYSIKVDTNFDNLPMLKIIDKLGYTYCGEVFFKGAARKAFEKIIPVP